MLDTGAAYLVITKAQSRIAGYYYLGNKSNAKPHPELNGSIIIECKTLKHVVVSASEAETGGRGGSQFPNGNSSSSYT